jgi:hypothetical protein
MTRLIALVLMFVLVGCSSVVTNRGDAQNTRTVYLVNGSFMTIPIQPWFCDVDRDGYCPLESKGLVGDTLDKVTP